MPRKPDKFDRMADRLASAAYNGFEKWLAAALRRVDRAAEKRGYQLGYDAAANTQAEIDAGEDL